MLLLPFWPFLIFLSAPGVTAPASDVAALASYDAPICVVPGNGVTAYIAAVTIFALVADLAAATQFGIVAARICVVVAVPACVTVRYCSCWYCSYSCCYIQLQLSLLLLLLPPPQPLVVLLLLSLLCVVRRKDLSDRLSQMLRSSFFP